MYELNRVNLRAKQAALVQQSIGAASERMGHLQALLWQSNLVQHSSWRQSCLFPTLNDLHLILGSIDGYGSGKNLH